MINKTKYLLCRFKYALRILKWKRELKARDLRESAKREVKDIQKTAK